MGHSYTSSLYHCIFSTKDRHPLLTPDLRNRLFPFMGGIARTNGMRMLEIGGIENHVHFLLSLPAPLAIAKAIQLIKGGSSKWVNDTFPGKRRSFAWQEGYGAFSISVSQVSRTIRYIQNQEEHHKRGKTFEQEFIAFLKRHGIEYDEKHVWG